MKSMSSFEDDPKNLSIDKLGAASITSPISLREDLFYSDGKKVLFHNDPEKVTSYIKNNEAPPFFQMAGPRKNIFFKPEETICGIVTCGGLCPGLNDVIRSITLTLLWQYKTKKVLGFRYGFKGITKNSEYEPMDLTPYAVDGIQHMGGTILGSSRGPQDTADMIETLVKNKVNILFIIGGDGTFRGAHELSEEIKKRGLKISIIGVPKTIDNDISGSETSFGFGTSVEEARKSIASAHEEAKAAINGIGLVKLMGRDSGFIASSASLANSDVNFCLVPEEPFKLDGENGLLEKIKTRLERRKHAVIVTAEGAGQDLLPQINEKDASGNKKYEDIGLFLQEKILNYMHDQQTPCKVKYINPSYTIRSCPANARDSIFCLMLGEMAVHAGMAGKTNMFVGFWNQHFTHVPLSFAVSRKRKLNVDGIYWQTVKAITNEEAKTRR